MAKLKSDIQDSEILSYSNVPINLAAGYLGVSPQAVRDALSQKCAPYGYAIKNEDSSKWAFHISAGALVSYQHGTLQTWDTTWLVERIAKDVEGFIENRYKQMLEMLFSWTIGNGEGI